MVSVAGSRNRGRRSIRYIAVHGAVAVVHRTDKCSRTLLSLLAPAIVLRSDAVARSRLRSVASFAGRTSFSSDAGQKPAAWAVHPAAAAAEEPASAAEPAAADSAAGPEAARLAGSTCFCDDACGADGLATVPDHSSGTTPDLAGAPSVLLSCVHFLALCYRLHSISWFSFSTLGLLSFPFPAARPA